MRWLSSAAVVLLAGAMLSCSAGDLPGNEMTAPDPVGDLLRVHRADPGAGMDAIVSGVVDVDLVAGCVWLAEPNGLRSPVVWPVGTAVRNEPFEIVLADGEVVRPGDRVEGGGGYVDADAATRGLQPFPRACVQVGEAAVFNASSAITVTAGVGLEGAETLLDRFSSPASIGLELVAVGGGNVVIVDFVTGTVHRYRRGQYASPEGAFDGASGGGGFIHLWAQGVISSYPGRLDNEPLVYEPVPLRQTPEVAPAVNVLPAPDGEHTWLVQPGSRAQPTLLELVNLVEVQVARLGSYELDGAWRSAGTTTAGLVLVTDDPEPHTALIGEGGHIVAEVPGRAVSVGWNGAAVVQPDGSLIVTNAQLADASTVDKPGDGVWVSVGGPVVPTNAPPVITGAARFLVGLADDPARGPFSSGDLIIVDSTGAADAIYEWQEGSHLATWSRGEGWVVVVEESAVTLIPTEGGPPSALGAIIPESHWVLTAG